MDSDIKIQLIKSVKNIKNKLKAMRELEDNLDLKHRKILKPITEPLETMLRLNNLPRNKKVRKISLESNEGFNSCSSGDETSLEEDDKNNINSKNELQIKTPNKFIDESLIVKTPHNDKVQSENKVLNVAFGLRSHGDKLMIGNTPVTFKTNESDPSNKISMLTLNNKNYEVTPGLSELLFQSKPDVLKITEKDKLIYKDILFHTNAHKRGFCSTGQIQGNSGMKYCKIIKPLFFEADAESVKQGGQLPTFKNYKSNTDFVYWDDPNELVDRLKMLVASKDAGNTNHDNEIISIIEELKEAGIIKE